MHVIDEKDDIFFVVQDIYDLCVELTSVEFFVVVLNLHNGISSTSFFDCA